MIRAFILFVLATSTLAGTLHEGDRCDRQGVPGTCTRARSCSSYTLLPEDPQVTFCSEAGEGRDALVCCTDCVHPPASKAAAVGRKSREKCLEYSASLPYSCPGGSRLAPRLVFDDVNKCHRLDAPSPSAPGTFNTQRNTSFPYMALLGYLNEEKEMRWSCLGAIISDRFVLTTGHCGLNASPSQVAVGVHRRLSPGSSSSAAPWQLYSVKRFTAHPAYRRPNHYSDIGLVETDTPMTFSESVLPVCLVGESSDEDPAYVDVLGDDDGTPEQEKVELKRTEDATCSAKIPPSRRLKEGIDFQTQTCYDTFQETPQSCKGSSGRPVYVSGEVPCAKYALAITAFGTSCRDGLTVYSRVHPYLDWIESTVWP